MPTTRSAARNTEGSSPTSSATAGSKRKADASPAASPSSRPKKETKAPPKKQKTLEDSMPKPEDESKEVPDVEMKDNKPGKQNESGQAQNEEAEVGSKEGKELPQEPKEEAKSDAQDVDKNESSANDQKEQEPSKDNGASGNAVEKSAEREKSTPSSILEKGIIYFFFRGRVGIDDPSGVDDVARSYIVLRPIPHGAKLGDGPMGDDGNNRVLALPKKVLPKSPKDRFMMFVEKAKVGLQAIKDDFLSASDYETKTAGPRHTPAATPIAEGVYCVTSTGRDSHLAYILTVPSEINEVQKDIGLQQRGSFVTSVKNPQYEGPAQAQLPEGPKFPKEILDEFRSLRWGPLQPKHLDYENCQFLLIGHKENAFEKATAPQNENGEKEDPKEEMEKLEHEDDLRVEHLKGDDTVFVDLDISAKDYPKVQTTW